MTRDDTDVHAHWNGLKTAFLLGGVSALALLVGFRFGRTGPAVAVVVALMPGRGQCSPAGCQVWRPNRASRWACGSASPATVARGPITPMAR